MTEAVSKRIGTLRVFLPVLVVLIHNNSAAVPNTAVSYAIKTLCSEILARSAVPLFFFISGYLLFRRRETYGSVLKKKARTLLVPYLLWNGIVVGLFALGQSAPYVSRFFQDESSRVAHYTLFQWLDAFLGLNGHGYPAAYQFWFVRDLMILTALFPLAGWLLRHAPAAALTAVALFWLLEKRMLFWDSEAALFFLLGAWTVLHDPGLERFDRLRPADLAAGYVFCIGTELWLLAAERPFIVVHKLAVLLGCMLWLRLSDKLAEALWDGAARQRRMQTLAGYTFFVYAAHEPLLTLLRKVWTAVLGDAGTVNQMAQYFGLIALAIALSLGAGWCVRKISPRLYGLLTGGRV